MDINIWWKNIKVKHFTCENCNFKGNNIKTNPSKFSVDSYVSLWRLASSLTFPALSVESRVFHQLLEKRQYSKQERLTHFFFFFLNNEQFIAIKTRKCRQSLVTLIAGILKCLFGKLPLVYLWTTLRYINYKFIKLYINIAQSSV